MKHLIKWTEILNKTENDNEAFNILNSIELNPEYKITIIIMDYNGLFIKDKTQFEIALERLINTKNVSVIAFCGNWDGLLLSDKLSSAFTLRIVFNTLFQEYSKQLIGTEDEYYLQDNNFITCDTKTNIKQLYLWNGLSKTITPFYYIFRK